MMIGMIASRVARRHCCALHEGASPCPNCAEIRYIAVEAIAEYIAELTVEAQRALRASPEY